MLESPKKFQISQLSKDTAGRISVKWLTDDGFSMRQRKLPPHQDFEKAVTKIEGYLARFHDYNEDRVILKQMSVKYYEDGIGESVSVKGTYTHPDSEQIVPCTTASIPLHLEHYGWETDLKKALTLITKEAKKFLFEDKSSQASLKLDKAS